MTNKMKNVPELRFPEFIEEWCNKDVGQVVNVYDGTHQTPKYTNKGIKFLSVENIKTLKSNKFISKEAFEKDFKVRPEFGDILMTRIGDVGTPKVVNSNEDLAYYVSLALLKPKSIHSYFLEALIKSPTIQNEIWRKTLHIAFPKKINKNEIAKIMISYPKSEEQEKIGEFFSKLDRQIELEEQKLAKLEEQKKGYMQQIFSQELRFKDENGNDYPNWEEVQLKDILIPRNYKQVPEINAPLMSFTSTGGIEPKGDRYNREFLVKNKNKKYKRTEFNDLIYSSNNLDVGAIGLNRYGTSVISDVYEIFKIEEQVSPYFIEMSILQSEFMYKILRYRQGALYGQYRIHANDFLKINIELPCSEEQYKIGDFVNKLDNIIDIINNKIELLKQRKRGFLQKMFV
ncbi:restriction endonuclease subunit S [Staphylococcus xylosus]